MYDCYDDCYDDASDDAWWEEDTQVTTPSSCESFTSEQELVERGQALNLPPEHFISRLIFWREEKGFWTTKQRRSFLEALLREEAYKEEAYKTDKENIVVKETSMPNLIISIPESVAAMLQEALDDKHSLVIQTRDLKLELTKEGKLTSCEFTNFKIVGEPVEVEEVEELPTPVVFSRPKLVKELPEEVKEEINQIFEEPVTLQPLHIVLSPRENAALKTIERREALIRLVRERGHEGLQQVQIALALSEQGFPCVASTVSNDLNILQEQKKVTVYNKRGLGRIYSVIESDTEACGF